MQPGAEDSKAAIFDQHNRKDRASAWIMKT
jgi:hypothetical protein